MSVELKRRRARILVVDADAAVGAVVQRSLQRDYDVVVETSSSRAFARVQSGERFDMVLFDRTLPQLDFLGPMPNLQLDKPFHVEALRSAVADALDAITPKGLEDRFDLATLDTEAAAIAVVSKEGSIVWVNAAWRAFGAANGARPESIGLGVAYFDLVQGDLRKWVVDAATRCMESKEVFESDYECSSPTQRRMFHMRMLPIPEVGLLLEHSLRLETPHDRAAVEPDLVRYTTEDGLIVMCSNCRRTRRADRSGWDWIPAWVAAPPGRVSHGLCFVCLDFYYP